MSEPLWQPSDEIVRSANVTRYCAWLKRERGLEFDDYASLWQWSVSDLDAFWSSLWDYFDIESTKPYTSVLTERRMPGARWFEGAELNLVQQVFRHLTNERPAFVSQSEAGGLSELSWPELHRQVAALAATLTQRGVRPGDRVVAYMHNIPETAVAFLATASVGAIWSLCSPDLGEQAVLDRFQQIEPKVLIAVDGYRYGGKVYERSDTVGDLVHGLPALAALVAVPRVADGPTGGISVKPQQGVTLIAWQDATAGDPPLNPVAVPFDHPLWIVYSSGTTGAPKAIVHGHGGVVLEHLKLGHLHFDLSPEDRFLWQSSTAWVMWNIHLGGLLLGTTLCTYDGNPGKPDLNRLWEFARDAGVTFFGAGAAFYDSCRAAGIRPLAEVGCEAIRAVGSTGSPLLPEAFRWIYAEVGADVYLNSVSGGTDFVSGFVGGVPTLPVYEGVMQCRCLGAAVYAFNDDGEPVIDEVGELVCTEPMPSMPLYFWNDEDGHRYRDSYFDVWPGVWRHGDWIRITRHGGAIIYGRSDATINRHGIRMGTSELYRVVEALPEVIDSLVVDLEYMGRESYMPLFVVLREGAGMDSNLHDRILAAIRTALSPRHVPNDVFVVDEVPRTFSGKKLEIPVRRLLLGQGVDKVINRDTMENPASIDYFIDFAARLESGDIDT